LSLVVRPQRLGAAASAAAADGPVPPPCVALGAERHIPSCCALRAVVRVPAAVDGSAWGAVPEPRAGLGAAREHGAVPPHVALVPARLKGRGVSD